MPATNKTENFNPRLYVASDHFSVLGDFNSANEGDRQGSRRCDCHRQVGFP